MKNFISIIILVTLASCSTLKVAQRKNTPPIKNIGVKTIYSSNIPPSLIAKIDSATLIAIDQFNCERHAFKLIPYQASDSNYIVLDFAKAKLISKRHRNISYIVNTAVPVISISAGMTIPVLVNYTPKHKINSTFTLSPGLSNEKNNSVRLRSRAGVLFSNVDAKEKKLFEKYTARLYRKFQVIDSLMSGNGSNIE